MPTPDSTRSAAERWFLDRGLPTVLTPRARWRALWPCSASVLAGYAALMVVGLLITVLVGNVHVDIEGEPTVKGWIVLGVLVACVPFVALTGWLVSRLTTDRSPFAASESC